MVERVELVQNIVVDGSLWLLVYASVSIILTTVILWNLRRALRNFRENEDYAKAELVIDPRTKRAFQILFIGFTTYAVGTFMVIMEVLSDVPYFFLTAPIMFTMIAFFAIEIRKVTEMPGKDQEESEEGEEDKEL